MVVRHKTIFYLNFLIIFSISFLNFLFLEHIKTNADDVLYIYLLLVNALILKGDDEHVMRGDVFKMVIFAVFLTILFIFSVKYSFLSYSILCSMYILIELLLFGYILSNLDFYGFKKIIFCFRNAYLLVNIPLFGLYLVDVLGIRDLYLPRRLIVFGYNRFGGLVSEPRGMAVFSILALATVLFAKRKRYQWVEVALILVMLYCTFSNAIVVFCFLFPLLYFFLKADIKHKMIYVSLLLPVLYVLWIIVPEFQIGRFALDKDAITYMLKNFSHIEEVKNVNWANAFNVRFWIFLKGLRDIRWYGLGFESTANIAMLQGLPQADAIGLVTILADFGWIVGGATIIYMIYIIGKYKEIDESVFRFLTSFFVLLFMSPPYARFYMPIYAYFFLLYKKAKRDITLYNHVNKYILRGKRSDYAYLKWNRTRM